MVSELILSLVKECLLPRLVEEAGSYAIQRAKGGRSVAGAAEAARRRRWPVPPGLRARRPTRLPLHVVPATSVVSATPGRARLRVAGLRGEPARARAVASRV